jgi:hypothetical protein
MYTRVGNNSESWNGVIGEQGEETLNNNGERLLNFCIMNDLIMLNTMFIHKDIYKITREELSKKEKSIIDYIIAQRETRKYIGDTRAKKNETDNQE